MTSIIDRRGAKSTHSENRKRFIDKHKSIIKRRVEKIYKDMKLTDQKKKGVKIELNSHEITGFEYERKYGSKVLSGNKKWEKGDLLPFENGEGDGKSEGILDLILTEQEFLKILFEDFSLPNLLKRESEETLISSYVRVGYALEGSPPLLNLKRSVVNGIGRALALEEAYDEMAEEIRKKRALEKDIKIQAKLTKELSDILENKKNILFLDKPDLRYIVKAPLMEPKTTALLYFVLDISGSVGEDARILAKKFFYLVYYLVKNNHDKLLIKFIRHTDVAEFIPEHLFFNEDGTGSTVLSSPLTLIKEDLEKNPALLKHNVYVVQASDGDNVYSDQPLFETRLREVVPLTQAFIYIEVPGTGWGKMNSSLPSIEVIRNTFPNLHGYDLGDSSRILPIFKDIFGKSGKNRG